MNKKASVGFVLTVLTIVIFTGIFLRTLYPVFEEFRLDNLNSVDSYDNPNNPLMKIFWYSFHPIMWFFWLVMSIFAVVFAVQQGANRL